MKTDPCNDDDNVYFYKFEEESLADALEANHNIQHFVGAQSLHLEEELHHCDLVELSDSLRGLEEFIEGNTKICTTTVNNSHQKEALQKDIEAYAKAAHCFPDFSKRAATVAWELIMNALYSAPRDAKTGRAIYQDQDRSKAVELPDEKSITLQYAKDNEAFWIYVKDPYGSLSRQDLIKTLRRGEVATTQETFKGGASGAGVGLYMVLHSVSQLLFRVEAARCTEVVVVMFQTKRNRDYDEHPPALSFVERRGNSP